VFVPACFNVGRNELFKGIYEQKLSTTAQIGEKLKAGTNCGSCISELKGLIRKVGK
jgi:assimilatory nitrate reductase catalytic subunit